MQIITIMNHYYVSGTVLSVLISVLSLLIVKATLLREYYYYAYVTDEEPKAQRGI